MKQSHECRIREPSNPNDWLQTRLVAPEFHCGVPRWDGRSRSTAPESGECRL